MRRAFASAGIAVCRFIEWLLIRFVGVWDWVRLLIGYGLRE